MKVNKPTKRKKQSSIIFGDQEKKLINKAAKISGLTLSALVRFATLERARKILKSEATI